MFVRPKQVGGSGPLKLACVFPDLLCWGTQRQGLQLARRLNPAKYQVEVWIMSGGDGLSPLAREWGLPVVWLSRSRSVGLSGIVGLARRLASHPPDILFPLTTMPNICSRILGRLARVPFIVGNCRGPFPEKQLERWLWPLADHLISNSRAIKERIIHNCRVPEEKVTVVWNGVDTEYFRPSEVRPEGPPTLVSMARLVPHKGHDTLLRAFRTVRENFPEARLWLLGEGPCRPALEKWVSSNLLAGSVKFFGGQVDVRPYLQQASLFVHSATREGLPNVVLEAMASGLPVVAARADGVPEAVIPGHTGWLVPPQDPKALAEAICWGLADPAGLAAMGQAGRRRAMAEFSFEAMVRRHEEVFDRLLTTVSSKQ